MNARYIKIGLVSAGILTAALAAWALYRTVPRGPAPTTFFECSHQYPVQGTSPRTCRVPWGKTFVEYEGNQPKFADQIQNLSFPPAPVLGASPFTFSGEAAPRWFASNGTFTVQLLAGTGQVIATAEAKQDAVVLPGSMFKRFTVTLTFTHPAAGTQGALVLKNGASTSTETVVVPVVY